MHEIKVDFLVIFPADRRVKGIEEIISVSFKRAERADFFSELSSMSYFRTDDKNYLQISVFTILKLWDGSRVATF